MGTKNDPGDFDCYANAEDDEPMFVLLARDPDAPFLVRTWATLRADRKMNSPEGYEGMDAKEEEARACATAMEAWRKAKS